MSAHVARAPKSDKSVFLTYLTFLKIPFITLHGRAYRELMKMRTRMVGLVFEQMIVSLQFVLSRFGIKLFVDELSRIVCVCDYQIPSYVVCLVSPRYTSNMAYHIIIYSGTEHNHEMTVWEPQNVDS